MTTTITRLYPQFNQPVVTPRGKGYFVGRDDDGLYLISVSQKPRPRDPEIKGDCGESACRHLWFEPEEVRMI